MSAKITFFPVGNGDMTLIQLDDTDKTTILVDINIRGAADDENDGTCDVAYELRKRLRKDSNGRPYVDVFLLSHPDKDHCSGLETHFHLGKLEDYIDEPPEGEDKKIVIREMWSSPIVFRRASKNHGLCDEAKAFNKDAKRRVKAFKDNSVKEGDRIKIIGEDEDGKTDDLAEILVKIDESFSNVNGKENSHIKVHVLAPFSKQEILEDEETLTKNHSSVVLQFSIAADKDNPDACYILAGGDAEVAIWEKLWEKHKKSTDYLKYDLLLAPHHCSWHSLSYDSWDGGKNDPQPNSKAKSALSQANDGAFIVSSSNPIKANDSDPPCMGAKNIYVSVVNGVSGKFMCTGEYPSEKAQEPLEFSITADGPQSPAKRKGDYAVVAGSLTTREPLYHG